ncbi:MAG: DUF2177 family protein [Pseudomonadota bacterium]
MTYVIAYFATAIVFLAIDALWLGVIATKFYKAELGSLMAENVNFVAAAGFYLVYCVGIVIFAVSPALRSGDWTQALLFGALFGFFCYATYDMTNLATLRDWPLRMSLVDMAWGTVLTGVSATAGYLITRSLT